MTLRELMYKVDDASRVERVPSVIKIVESGSPVVSSMKMGDEIEVTAFRNGFVIYQNGIRAQPVVPRHRNQLKNTCSDGHRLVGVSTLYRKRIHRSKKPSPMISGRSRVPGQIRNAAAEISMASTNALQNL